MLNQKQRKAALARTETMRERKAAEAARAAAMDPAEAARIEREAIAAWLATRPGEEWDKDTNKRPAAELAAEAESRKAAGVVELTTKWNIGRTFPAAASGRKVPNPVAAWQEIERAEVSRLELADFAREAKRLEREAKRNRPDTFKRAAVKRSAEVLLADMPAAEVVAKSGAKRAASDYAAMAEVAADLGVEISELAEALETEKLLAAEQTRPLMDVKSEVGYAAELTPAEVLERKARAAEILQLQRAKTGREVLDSIGPRASAVVVSYPNAASVTVSLVRTVPDLAAAVTRCEALAKPLAEAREALAEAEKKAAAKTLNAEARKAAEAAADSKAAAVRKLAAKLERAEANRALAEELASMPAAADLVAVPIESFKLAEAAAKAAALEIPARNDRMPSAFVERGPRVRTSASWSGDTKHGGRAAGISDPTGDSAAALVDGYLKALAKVERAAAKLAAQTNAEAVKAAAVVKVENNRSAYKAREAARARANRRKAKNKN